MVAHTCITIFLTGGGLPLERLVYNVALFGLRKEETKAPETVPQHIAVIMDGNGRWAKKRGMPRLYGQIGRAHV